MKNFRNPLNLWLMVLPLTFGVFLMCGKKKGTDEAFQDEKQVQVMSDIGDPMGLDENGKNPLRGNKAAIEAGEKHFRTLCANCHGADAKGMIGPNLTDDQWLHTDNDKGVYDLISKGIGADQMKQNPPKGPMPQFKNTLGERRILEVMAWLADKNSSLKP